MIYDVDIYQTMGRGELQLLLIEQDGKQEANNLASMVEEYRWLMREIEVVKTLAQGELLDYTNGEEESLEYVKFYVDYINTLKTYKSRLRQDIKESRERVQWLRKEYLRAKQSRKSSE